jgi:hypothetical protein
MLFKSRIFRDFNCLNNKIKFSSNSSFLFSVVFTLFSRHQKFQIVCDMLQYSEFQIYAYFQDSWSTPTKRLHIPSAFVIKISLGDIFHLRVCYQSSVILLSDIRNYIDLACLILIGYYHKFRLSTSTVISLGHWFTGRMERGEKPIISFLSVFLHLLKIWAWLAKIILGEPDDGW